MCNSLHGRRDSLKSIGSKPVAHAGLWLDKFLKVLSPASDSEKGEIRALMLKATTVVPPKGYARAVGQREAMLRQCHGGIEGGVTKVWEASVLGRMVIGLGIESLRETNISLEPTWGVPLIPGSALKGLAAGTAHRRGGPQWWGQPTEKNKNRVAGEDALIMFGDTSRAGCVVFHDAWWIPSHDDSSIPLDLDIMTVHHAKYYAGGKEAPADWDEPNPVSFLTARGTYMVALSGPPAWVDAAFRWIELGAKLDGIGGKTRAGYGRLGMTAKLTAAEQVEENKRLAQEKEAESWNRKLERLAKQRVDAATAPQRVDSLREAISQGCPAAVVQNACAALVAADRTFWKKWIARKTADEQEELGVLGMSVAVEPTVPSPTNNAPQDAHTEVALSSKEGVAWAVKIRKNRKVKVRIHVAAGELTMDARPKIDVEASEELLKQVESATSREQGIAVIFEYDASGSNPKLKSLRALA